MKTQLCILIAAAFLMIGVGCNKSEPATETQDNAVAGASETKAEEPKAEAPKAEAPKAEAEEQKAPEVDVRDTSDFDKNVISAVVKDHTDGIRKCYEDGIAKSKGLVGKITFKWNITADGTVENVVIKDSTLENDEFKTCLTKEIGTWKFQEPRNGSTVEIEYPFEFGTGE